MTNGHIKLANRKFTTIPNDYCITFNESTTFDLVEEDAAISKTGFAFKKINELKDLQTRSSVDVIGVISDVTPLSQIKLKSGEDKDRRTITLMDDTHQQVDITFWGACAKVAGLEIGKVVAIKDCRVSDYRGVSLNGPFDANDIKVEEQIGHPRYTQLKKWSVAHDASNVESLTQRPNNEG